LASSISDSTRTSTTAAIAAISTLIAIPIRFQLTRLRIARVIPLAASDIGGDGASNAAK